MDKIKAKQVEGVVDTGSAQTITGNKTFQGVQSFPGPEYTLSIFEDKLYWVQNQGTLEETANMRLFCKDGRFVFEYFEVDTWLEQGTL